MSVFKEILNKLYTLPVWQEFGVIVSEKNITLREEADANVLTIIFHFPCQLLYSNIQQALTDFFPHMTFHIQSSIKTQVACNALVPHPAIKNIIAVASGKGGVGKSTVAINLALALRAEGATVGILDADIYGPSLPTLLGIDELPASPDGNTLLPISCYDLQAMSIGFLLQEKDTAMIWRGPMASGALQQLYRDCQWRDLDYLIIDLPPGTGDIQLTLVQKLPLTAALIVTTPQNIATADAQKAFRMFEKVNVPVLGIIENMSGHVCKQCNYQENVFGSGGGYQIAQTYQLPLLGQLPLDVAIRQDCDEGKPSLVSDPNSAVSLEFKKIAIRATALLAETAVYKPNKIPKIVVG